MNFCLGQSSVRRHFFFPSFSCCFEPSVHFLFHHELVRETGMRERFSREIWQLGCSWPPEKTHSSGHKKKEITYLTRQEAQGEDGFQVYRGQRFLPKGQVPLSGTHRLQPQVGSNMAAAVPGGAVLHTNKVESRGRQTVMVGQMQTSPDSVSKVLWRHIYRSSFTYSLWLLPLYNRIEQL